MDYHAAANIPTLPINNKYYDMNLCKNRIYFNSSLMFCCLYEGVMTELDASHNKIMYLPSPDVWDCKQLYNLDLGSNRLGMQQTVPVQSPK